MTKTVETVHTKKAGLKNNKKAMQKAFLNIAIYQTDRINHIDRSVFCIKKKKTLLGTSLKGQKEKEMKKNKTEKGITLVALIITIIVLLILAVVAIGVVTGEGILFHAKDASTKYADEADKENSTLQGYAEMIKEQTGGSSSGDTITMEEAKSDIMLSKTTNSTTYDEDNNKIVVPAGFKITADASHVSEGIVIQDAAENEFVWIPVGDIKKGEDTKTITLGRYSWSNSAGTLEQPKKNAEGTDWETGKSPTDELAIPNKAYNYTELQPTVDGKGPNKNAIAKNINDFYNKSIANGGYYIGRYEARTTSTTARQEKDPLTEVTCKKENAVYNWITQPDASSKCQAMYQDATTFTSDLMNSYAWDTAIVFIQSFGQNNYSQQGSLNSGSVSNTGTTDDKQCNIYDMASNCHERTTETSNVANIPCAGRGGGYDESDYSGYRYSVGANDSRGTASFRPLLYL